MSITKTDSLPSKQFGRILSVKFEVEGNQVEVPWKDFKKIQLGTQLGLLSPRETFLSFCRVHEIPEVKNLKEKSHA